MYLDIGDILLIKEVRGKVIDDAIKFFSGGNFAHTACVVEANKSVFEMNCPKGAIIRPLSDYCTNNYTVLTAHHLHLTGAERLAIKQYLLNLVHQKIKYDYKGIVGQLFRVPDKINNAERMYCSEAVGLAYYAITGYMFSGLKPSEQAPKDQGFDVISKQHIWENDYIQRSIV